MTSRRRLRVLLATLSMVVLAVTRWLGRRRGARRGGARSPVDNRGEEPRA